MRWIINLMLTSLLFFPDKEFVYQPEQFGLNAENAWCRAVAHLNTVAALGCLIIKPAPNSREV